MSKILRLTPKVVLIIILIVMTSGIKPHTASAQEPTVGANSIILGTNLLQDPSFEASYGSTTGPWFQNPLDTICIEWAGICNINGAGYHSGGGWAGFGPQSNSFGDVYQEVTFPKCGAQLEFHLYIGEYFDPGSGWGMDNYFAALIDDVTVFEAYGYQVSSYSVYTKVSIDVSQFADGAVHRVEFSGELFENFLFFNLDDVALRPIVNPSSGCAAVGVEIAGATQAYYGVPPSSGDRVSYGLNTGPVVIFDANYSVPFVASERVGYFNGTKWTSFSEMMGLPWELVSTSYYFPFYNNVNINTQLRFANVGNANTTVTVRIGGVLQGTYNLVPNQVERRSYAVNSGPVVIQSSGGVPIVASERVAYHNGTKWTSFNEMMGLPASQLSTAYLFPWFNNVNLNSQLRFGNVGTTSTNVTVRIGGVLKGTYPLPRNATLRVAYPVDSGPVLIQSSGGVPIVASLRVGYTPDNGATWPDVSEMMGFPVASVGTSYNFPWYNNVDINTQLRFANAGSANTTVKVKIGGVLRGTYNLVPKQGMRQSYPVNSGPVVIESSGGVPIIASERVAYFNGTKWTSFSEMMGLPASQLSTFYVFPFYNNVDLNTQLRFSVP